MHRDQKKKKRSSRICVSCTFLKVRNIPRSIPADFSSYVTVLNYLSLKHSFNKRNEAGPIKICPLGLGSVSVSFHGHSHSEKVNTIIVLNSKERSERTVLSTRLKVITIASISFLSSTSISSGGMTKTLL